MLPTIIYEDDNILAINKPSGLVVHPFDYSTEQTLVDFLQEYYKEKNQEMPLIENNITLQDGRVIPLFGIVHKLDRDTSGIMIIAKNQIIFDELKKQFVNHTIKKTYIAMVDGILKENVFTIDAPLGRSKKDYKQSTNPKNPRGELRPAKTDVKVLKSNTITSLVTLSPKTGRTHQLRAHMSSVGNPIVGDIAYGSKIDKERIMLHAESLEFEIGGTKYSFVAEVPNEFFI